MESIIEYKWLLLLGLEVLAWSSTFFMLFARYRLNSRSLFKIGVWLTIITGVIPQVSLGVVIVVFQRKIDLFSVVIVLLVLYGLTIGREHIRQMDQWAKRKFGG
ncbi:MAG: hypothetical protein H0Z32_09465 [Bacillaceae bacterium]|nr:hypothetical protein [Bacillaceae bacterium]